MRGSWVVGPETPPHRETHDAARERLVKWSGNVFSGAKAGEEFVAWVWAVTFSGAWGSEPAWAEWSQVAVSNPVTVQAAAPKPIAQANVPAALSVFQNVVYPNYSTASVFERWANANPRESQTIGDYLRATNDGRTVSPPKVETRFGKALVGIVEMVAWLKGVHA